MLDALGTACHSTCRHHRLLAALLLTPLACSTANAFLSPGSPYITSAGSTGAISAPVSCPTNAAVNMYMCPGLLHAHICCKLDASSGIAWPICSSPSLPPAAAHTSSILSCFLIPRQPIQHPCWVHWSQHLLLPRQMRCLPLLFARWQHQPPLQQCPIMPPCTDSVGLVCRPAHACYVAAVAAVAVAWCFFNHARAIEQLHLQRSKQWATALSRPPQ
jgi:hypothetical protein